MEERRGAEAGGRWEGGGLSQLRQLLHQQAILDCGVNTLQFSPLGSMILNSSSLGFAQVVVRPLS